MGLALSSSLRSINSLCFPTAGYALIWKVEPSPASVVTELGNGCLGTSVNWFGGENFPFQPVSSVPTSVWKLIREHID